MPLVEGLDQQTPEWLHMRVGCVTASRISDVMSRLKVKSKNGEKGDPSAKCLQYQKEIIYETLTGRAWDHFVSPAMEFGMENEELARAAYEIETGTEVLPGGFFLHDEISEFGASPDGLVGTDGLVEYKCPPSAHLDILRSREIPEQYEWQMIGEIACSGRQWCDFVSFDPRMPKQFRMFIKRFWPGPDRIKEVQDAVCVFLLEVIAEIKKLEAGQ